MGKMKIAPAVRPNHESTEGERRGGDEMLEMSPEWGSGRGLGGAHLCVSWQCAAACARPGRAASPPPPGPLAVSSYSASPSSDAFG